MERRSRFPTIGDAEIRDCQNAIAWGNGTRAQWVDELIVWREITEFIDKAFGSDSPSLSFGDIELITEQLEFDSGDLLGRAKFWSGTLFDRAQEIASETNPNKIVWKLIELERAAKTEADARQYELGLAVLRARLHDELAAAAEDVSEELDVHRRFAGFTIPQLVAFIREHGGVNQEGRRMDLIINDDEASAWVSLRTLDEEWRGILVDLETGLTEAGEKVFEI